MRSPSVSRPLSSTQALNGDSDGRLSVEARERAGIRESLVRVAVGLESVADLQRDLAQALAA